MLVVIHSPVPATVGVTTNGGDVPGAGPPIGTTGRLNATINARVHRHAVRFVGWLNVGDLQEAGGLELERDGLREPQPAALDAVASTFTTYPASRFNRSVGEKTSWLPLTRTSPDAFGSMLKAALVLAGSID